MTHQQNDELSLLDDEFHKTLLNKKTTVDEIVNIPVEPVEDAPIKKINIAKAAIIASAAVVIVLAVIGYFVYQLQPSNNFISPEIKSAPTIEKPPESVIVPAVKSVIEKPVKKIAAPAAEPTQTTPAPSPIKITTIKPAINPAIERGYEAFNSGNYDAARIEYEQALVDEPKNGDILISLAIISVKNGQLNQAKKYYQSAIDINPKDALAVAGMIALQRQDDAESNLQSIISEQPSSAIPHFVLGNTYAQQNRWADAQQEYFKAYIVDRNNPDIIYNLAISLDKLKQPTLALKYYNEALGAAENNIFNFNKSAAITRIKVLSDETN